MGRPDWAAASSTTPRAWPTENAVCTFRLKKMRSTATSAGWWRSISSAVPGRVAPHPPAPPVPHVPERFVWREDEPVAIAGGALEHLDLAPVTAAAPHRHDVPRGSR